MMILKNLWHRRKANGWLFAELIIVTFLLCFLLDPAIVMTHVVRQPLGYDADRLVIMEFDMYPKSSDLYKAENDSADVKEAALHRIIAKIKNMPGVERVSYLPNIYINSGSLSSSELRSGNPAIDTISYGTLNVEFLPGTEFFETYGINAAEGSPAVEELSANPLGNGVIITHEVADLYWPGQNAVGKRFVSETTEDGDTVWCPVVGVVENVKYRNTFNTGALYFTNSREYVPSEYGFYILIRLTADTDADEFSGRNFVEIRRSLADANIYLSGIKSYSSILDETAYQSSDGSKLKVTQLLALFFILNLIFGTVSTMWLQTRKRIREVGVLRSYGATRGNILTMLMSESAVLLTAGFLIGVFLFLQWGLKFGLSKGTSSFISINMSHNWVAAFWPHFLILVAVSYVILLAAVLAGTYLPARNLSRINPVDALRDE
ncbi:MAG: FtsX-like permease family protein [Muribaculaceae bacterium]|nr:FtsX-like permease family protein [Muribaculaceae bacterium]